MSIPEVSSPRPSFPRRFLRRLFSWRGLRRGLIGLAALITLVALFYTIEDIRGKRAWSKCKSELEAKGVVFDWNAYIPPPVPDDQNFFKAPKMQEWFVGRGSTELSRRLNHPATGWVGSGKNVITNTATAEEYLRWSATLEPDFNRIREALQRPYARIEGDYTEPYAIPIPNFVTMRAVAQTLSQRAHCYFLLDQPDKALRELTLVHGLCRLLEARPTGKPMTLLAAMINVAVTGLYTDMIAEGMRREVWHEAQLTALEEQLAGVNLPPLVAEAFRDERAATAHTFEKTPPSVVADQFIRLSGGKPSLWRRLKEPFYTFMTFAPRGWVYQNMVRGSALEQQMIDAIQPDRGIVAPDQINIVTDSISKLGGGGIRPYTFLVSRALPNYRRAIQVLARRQTAADEARVACALERYRLAQGAYPETLDALAPRFIDKLPHDIIDGQPLKYRRTDDGKFLLYSIGWNQKDDDGVPAPDNPAREDFDSADWVWR